MNAPLPRAALLWNPKDEAYKPMPNVGTDLPDLGSEKRRNQFFLAIAFLAELTDPEGLGHAVTDEVRRRASRILKCG